MSLLFHKVFSFCSLSFLFVLCLLCTIVLSGCTSEKLPDGMPKLFPCTIKVQMEGKPLDGANVTISPIEKTTTSQTAGGITDQSGCVVIKTNGQYKGAPAGKYKVTVGKKEMFYQPGYEPENIKIESSGDEQDDAKTRRYIAQERAQWLQHVATDYGDEITTPLTIEVGTGAKQFDVEVKPSGDTISWENWEGRSRNR